MTDQPQSGKAFEHDKAGTVERRHVEAVIEDLRQKGGAFVETVRASRMTTVLSDPALPGNPIVFANPSFLDLSAMAWTRFWDSNPSS